MTEDYKDSVFGYITGNVPYEPVYDPTIQLEDTHILDSVEGENRIQGTRYLLKDVNGEENGLVLYVVNIEDQETGHNRAWCQIETIQGEVLKVISYFTSGAELPWIADVYVEDDGTLFICTLPESTSFPHRIMMLNNPSNKINGEYVLKIRKSYDIADYVGESAFYCDKIYKSLTEAKYILVGHERLSSGTRALYEILEATINVGSENEYNLITTSEGAIQGSPWIYDTYIKWNIDGEYRLKILVGTNETPQNYINELWKDYTASQLTHKYDISCNNTLDRRFLYSEYEQLILGLYYQSTSRKLYYSLIYSGTYVNLVDDEDLIETYSSGNIPDLQRFSHFNIKNDTIYIPITKNDSKTYMYAYKAIYYEDGSYSTYRVCNKKIYDSGYFGTQELIINNVYELYNLYTFVNIQLSSTTYMNAHLLNQYVIPYAPQKIDSNQYYPYVSILRDDDKILFARTLYNLIRQQNTITSTINVPNQMLNDDTIKKELLYSRTYNTIDDDSEEIEKNVYENLLINFNDTYTVVNNNDNQNIVNTMASVDLVKDMVINRGWEKEMLKFRIVYQDDSEAIDYLPTPTMDDDNRIAEYYLVIGSDKPINRIEFISLDETTTYLIITLNIDANKVYKISQKVRVR